MIGNMCLLYYLINLCETTWKRHRYQTLPYYCHFNIKMNSIKWNYWNNLTALKKEVASLSVFFLQVYLLFYLIINMINVTIKRHPLHISINAYHTLKILFVPIVFSHVSTCTVHQIEANVCLHIPTWSEK